MRQTQLIGLTNKAEEFVKDAKRIDSTEVTFGMFNEEIPLRRWEDKTRTESQRVIMCEGVCIQEVVQFVVWSSGPMIFTCLKIELHNGASIDRVLEWVLDPEMRGSNEEYNREKGTYWI